MVSCKRIAIIGTSTSIMRGGYAPYLSTILKDAEVTNFSLGGAPSIYGNFIMDKEKIADRFDVAIIDFCINDQQLERSAFLKIEDVMSAFGAMLSHFTPNSQCRPLVILFPQRAAFKDDRLTKVRNLVLNLCRSRGISVIDVFDLVNRSSLMFDANRDDFFQDWTHMRKDHSSEFAKLLAKTIDRVKPAKATKLRFPVYRAVIPEELPLAVKSTSFVTANTYVLREDVRYNLEVNGYLCGFVHWQNEDTGTLLVEAGNRRLALPARKTPPWDNRLAFSNFPSAVRANVACIRVGLDRKFPVCRSFGYGKDLPMNGTEIALCGFVVAESDPIAAGRLAIRRLRSEVKPRRLSIAEYKFVLHLGRVSSVRKFFLIATLRAIRLFKQSTRPVRACFSLENRVVPVRIPYR